MSVYLRSARRPVVIASGGIALLAVLVRLPGAFSQPFWQDEVASARILRAPNLGAVLLRVAHTESTPPFWYCLAWVTHAIGVPLQDVRLLSVAAGGILAGATVVLARRVTSLPFAAAAGVLVALGGEYVARGQELRAYELFALLSVVFALCLVAELSSPSGARELRLAAVVTVGSLTHYFFAFTVLAALAWLQVDPRARALARRASFAIVAGGAVALGWAPFALQQYHQDRFSWIGAFRLRYVLAVPLRLFTPAYNDSSLGLVLSSLAAVALVLAALKLARRSPEGGLVVSLALIPLACAAVVWAGGIHIFALRNLIAVGPFAAIAIAAGAQRLPRFAAVALVPCLCLGLALSLELSTANAVPRFDAIAHSLVHDGWRPSDPIAVFGSPAAYRSPLEWYLPHQPRLVAARASGRGCAGVFVVSPSGRVRVLQRVGRGRRLSGATILVDPTSGSRCRRLLSVARRHPRRVTAPRPYRRPRATPPTPATAGSATHHRKRLTGVPILMYHVINPAPANARFPGLYVEPAAFAAQMQALAAAGYRAVTLDQVAANWAGASSLPPGRPIVISFDNGYRSQYTNALPVLRRLHWRAVENLQLTGLPPSQGGLNAREIHRLVDAGWELDTQGFAHLDLPTFSTRQLRHEVLDARMAMRRRYHVAVHWFCYPSGRYDPVVEAAVKSAGYAGATTVVPGWASASADPYRLPRLRVFAGTAPAALLALIAGTRSDRAPPGTYAPL